MAELKNKKKTTTPRTKPDKPVAAGKPPKTKGTGKQRGGRREGSGRPKGPWKFKTPAELSRKIAAYFADCDPHWEWQITYSEKRTKEGKPIVKNGYAQYDRIKVRKLTSQKEYTVTGLCIWLNTSRETLLDYESGKYDLPAEDGKPGQVDFSDTIKHAKMVIKEFWEQKLGGPSATGPIFNLKNNWGYKDRSEVEQKNTHEIDLSNKSSEQLDEILREYHEDAKKLSDEELAKKYGYELQ